MASSYTDIVEIAAPRGARAGEQVNVAVRVKNLLGYPFYIAVTAIFDSTQFPLSPEYASVAGGEIHSFNGSFSMPERKVTVWAYSWYWDGSKWVEDDKDYVVIDLAELVPEFSEFTIRDYLAL
jgi:hypothetical protein